MSPEFGRIPLAQIIIQRDERQRREIDTSDLIDSVAARGVLCPIIIRPKTEFDEGDGTHVLIAGERRLATSKELNLPDIPYRLLSDLSPIEAQIIEFEENVKRRDLPWQDTVNAVARVHHLYQNINADWSQSDTAKALSLSPAIISQMLRVSKSMDDPRIAKAAGHVTAYNILSRLDERKANDVISDIIEAGNNIFAKPSEPATAAGSVAGAGVPKTLQPAPAPLPESILNENFIEWVRAYSGPKFNFIHCDFPYGIDVFAGKQSGRDRWTTYDDHKDVYWKLLGAFCSNLDKFMAHSAHLMFWYSMEYYNETLEFFKQYAPSLTLQKFPLIWVKSDNVGILPDPKRGPRRVYETALIASREDRLIIKAVNNAYNSPTDKQHHHSTKPEPMLRHFFQMFVDETSKVFDPTCGSGSALRAAESLGAKSVLGLEVDKEHCDNAKSALRQFRALRKAAKVV